MYTHAKFVVKKVHTITDPSILGKGVRQVDGLRPFFQIFNNDIDSIFSPDTCFPVQLIDAKLNCISYADDLLLLSESKEGLLSCLDSVKAYCDIWKLKVNLNKTKIMIHFFL